MSVFEYGVHKPSGSCTAPLLSDPLCAAKSLGATICVQSGCDAAGIHIVKLWLDNVPFKTPTIIGCCEPDGETTIHEFKSEAKVTETGQSSLGLSWNGTTEISLSLGYKATISSSGTASLDGGSPSAATLTDTITNLLPMPLTANIDLVTAAGTIEYGGSVVATIGNDLLTWTGVCAIP